MHLKQSNCLKGKEMWRTRRILKLVWLASYFDLEAEIDEFQALSTEKIVQTMVLREERWAVELKK